MKFECLLRICMLDQICKYLSSDINIELIECDLFQLLVSSKEIKKIMLIRFVQNNHILLSSVLKWNINDNIKILNNQVHRLLIDINIFDFNEEIYDLIENMMPNLTHLTIENTNSTFLLDKLLDRINAIASKKLTHFTTDDIPTIFPNYMSHFILMGHMRLLPIRQKSYVNSEKLTHLTIRNMMIESRDILFHNKNNITHLTMENCYNFQINEGIISDNVTDLTFGDSFNTPINYNVLPKKLKKLKFGNSFNKSIDFTYQGIDKKMTLIQHLTDLTFGDSWNQRLYINFLPKGLKHLTFGNSFNQNIELNILPDRITHLTFGDSFDKVLKINVLPKNLIYLKFGRSFQQQLDIKVLPNKLKHLIFGYYFNSLLSVKQLPDKLTHLTFDHIYNKIIKPNVLPKSLSHLTFGHTYDQVIGDNVLPNNLTYLTFGDNFNQHFAPNVLPFNLKYLTLGLYFNKKSIENSIPINLKKLLVHRSSTLYLHRNEFNFKDDILKMSIC